MKGQNQDQNPGRSPRKVCHQETALSPSQQPSWSALSPFPCSNHVILWCTPPSLSRRYHLFASESLPSSLLLHLLASATTSLQSLLSSTPALPLLSSQWTHIKPTPPITLSETILFDILSYNEHHFLHHKNHGLFIEMENAHDV